MIEDSDRLAATPAHRTALHCIEEGIGAAVPKRVVREQVGLDGDRLVVADESYDLADFGEVVVVGGGKAAAGVAAALEDLLGDRLSGGVVVTNAPEPTDRVDVVEASHPVPDAAGVEGAQRVRETVAAADAGTLVLAVVAGGASALLPAPVDGLALDDLQAVTDALLASGAAIEEINAVRKHCSALKGGLLARAAAPATVVSLLFSDVVGDDPAVIGSGPTAPDPSTFAEAVAVLDGYEIDAPAAVRERLKRGAAGELAETPTADDDCFERVHTHVLANAWTALAAAREAAAEAGFRTLVLSSRVEGEAREAGRMMAAVAAEIAATGNPVEPPAVVLSGGETTVTVAGGSEGAGRGGPNTEFALSAARTLPDTAVLASVDTDGEDGASGAVGALVDAETVDDRAAATAALRANDAASYLADRDALIETGRTGTNVNDLRVLVVTAA
jgi:hydroxypyruvate reductase